MTRYRAIWVLILASLLEGCMSDKPRYFAKNLDIEIGGRRAVSLEWDGEETPSQPVFLRAEILPGRGFNTYQLRAFLPGRGQVNLLTAPPLEEALTFMNGGPDDFYGNRSFTVGGAILIPYANRIRGKFLEAEKAIETTVAGKTVRLPANWRGKQPQAEWHAMHGLILDQPLSDIALTSRHGPDGHATVTGKLDAGDFRGHWLSKTHLEFSASLRRDAFEFSAVARNTGSEPAPIGIGWHPYFELPGGNRELARLHVPARQRALVNNYDDVFPTGQLVPVKGTPYDFSAPGGAPLRDLFLDDCFVDLVKNAAGETVAEIVDPGARYGIRIIATAPEVTAIQVYAPVNRNFIALEPQFNWADPFSPIWKGRPTGMVMLAPGQSVRYHVRLELFQP
jgi:aldose 1-epimerase